MDILETVRNMTGGRVNIGSGTLYDLLEQFVEEEIIAETRTEGRRRSYIITEKGKGITGYTLTGADTVYPFSKEAKLTLVGTTTSFNISSVAASST